MPRVSQQLRIAAFLLLLTFVPVGASLEAADNGPILAQTVPPVPNVSSGRSYNVDIGIVVVLFGGALFAVCRSSNRS